MRIPAPVMEATQLRLDEVVDVREAKGRIVIELLCRKTCTLESLLKGINSGNLHNPVDFAPPAGKEIW